MQSVSSKLTRKVAEEAQFSGAAFKGPAFPCVTPSRLAATHFDFSRDRDKGLERCTKTLGSSRDEPVIAKMSFEHFSWFLRLSLKVSCVQPSHV